MHVVYPLDPFWYLFWFYLIFGWGAGVLAMACFYQAGVAWSVGLIDALGWLFRVMLSGS